MPHPISTLGLVHTLVSLAPVTAGLYGFIRFQRIDASTRSGMLYLAGLAVSVITSFGLSSTGGINAGHVLGVLALAAALSGAWLVPRLTLIGRLRPHLQTLGLSFSFFLLLVPGIVETLTRLPTTHPLATGPEDSVVRATLLTWLIVFIVGVALQIRAIDAKARRSAMSPAPRR